MIRAEIKKLRLLEPFRIAHGVSSEREVLRVYLEKEGRECVGEAPFVPYYPEHSAETLEWVRGIPWDARHPVKEGPRAGVLALDLLLHDSLDSLRHIAKDGVSKIPPGCRSLGIPQDLDAYAERARETSRQFRVIKLKLGSGNADFDEAIVARAAQSVIPGTTLFADANGGWSPQEAAALIPKFRRWELKFIEQPVTHKLGVEAWKELRSLLPAPPFPIFADESVQTSSDIAPLAPYVDGVNVKLLKCGTVVEAVQTIQTARRHGKQVLLGCMIESSVGVTAAAHLAGLADWIDLDGHLWLADDDYEGISYDKAGCLAMPDRPGIGVRRKEKA